MTFTGNRSIKKWLLYLVPASVLFTLLASSYYRIAVGGLWANEEYAYAPLLAVTALLLFLLRTPQLFASVGAGEPLFGGSLLLLGLIGYFAGHSQRIELVELFSGIPLLAGFIATAGGRQALKTVRFPLFFLLFTIPYPSWILYLLTSPLKTVISVWTELLLHSAGYPVARSGVILAVGSYHMLVADACSGMHSLIFLVALGLLYLHLTGPRHLGHLAILIMALVPIGVLANFIRVVILVLTTYHFGEAAAQSYYHTFAGLLLFVCAFLCLFTLDELLTRLQRLFPGKVQSEVARKEDASSKHHLPDRISPVTSIVLTLILLLTVIGAERFRPQYRMADSRKNFDLERLLPGQIGEYHWELEADGLRGAQVNVATLPSQYSQVLNRTYVNDHGYRVMLSISYGGNQLGSEFQAHRPESCYRAHGFVLLDSSTASVTLGDQVLELRQLVARQNTRIEPISYWMTIGDIATMPGVPRKIQQLRYSLRGVIPDGMLIRISSIDGDLDHAFAKHVQFIKALRQTVCCGFGFNSPES